MTLLAEFFALSESTPNAPAVISLDFNNDSINESIALTYGELATQARKLATHLRREYQPGASIGIVMGNSLEWVISDLALFIAGLIEVPVPLAFSAEQASHLLHNCQAALTDTEGEMALADWRKTSRQTLPIGRAISITTAKDEHPLPLALDEFARTDVVCKIIHTSGSTNKPKGVRIRRHGLDALIKALWARANREDYLRYLTLVPFSLLIEQVTALYMPFTAGGAVILPPASLPPLGSVGVTAAQRLELIKQATPSALTLTPALTEAIYAEAQIIASEHGENCTGEISRRVFGADRIPFMAVGGAPVDAEMLRRLDSWGIPIFQGYGLSENSSVVTWNYRSCNRIGTVGRPLPHVEVKLAPDGELCVRSTSLFAGYSSEDPSSCEIDAEGWLHTGDIATIDADGYVAIVGRHKTLIITSNGRNISPEWLESQYRTIPGIEQAIIYGDKQQFIRGIFLIKKGEDFEEMKLSIQSFSESNLSEIERIVDPQLMTDSDHLRSIFLTVTGRPNRGAVQRFINSNSN